MRFGVVLLLGTACSKPFRNADEPQVVAISVDPAEVTLLTGPNGGDPQQFTATATYDDGSIATLDSVDWTVSNRTAGTIDDSGLFTPSTTNGGLTWVTARFDKVEGSATATVQYVDEQVEDGVDPSLFDRSGTTGADLWLYPEDQVDIPRNTPSIRFEWQDPFAADGSGTAEAYRIRFHSKFTDFTLFTTATSYTADDATWATIAATNAGGEVQIDLSAANADEVRAADTRTVKVNRMDAQGTIIYWSSSAGGFKAIPYGGEAYDFLTQAQTGYCVGCHAISSQGILSFTYDGGDGQLGVKMLEDLSDIVGYGDSSTIANFKTYSPDGQWMLGTSGGTLELLDGLTGEVVATIDTGGTVSQPDWSPDGDKVALVLTDEHSADWIFSGGRIAVMDAYSDGTFGTPQVIYDPGEGLNAYYPAFSPDGRWIAFDVSSGDSYDDTDAELWVIPAQGGDAIRLDAANTDADLTNSWPRWGPLPDDKVLWLAFASDRAYGTVVSDQPQIWVTAFDPDKAAAGRDPSSPAFWLPGQDTGEHNHIPLWASLP